MGARVPVADWRIEAGVRTPTRREPAAVRDEARAGGLSARAIGVLLVALVSGCASPPAPPTPSEPAVPIVIGGCELLEPRGLLSGDASGQPTRIGDRRFVWGSGPDRLTEAVGEFGVGHPDSFGIPGESVQRVSIRGADAVVLPVGDEGVGEIAITWQAKACPYTIWLAPGTSLEDAIGYAARF